MTTLARARKIALALPEVTEAPHHDLASFRVRGKIFATVPDDRHLRVMVDEPEIRAAVAENPDACEELYWGKRLACVVVDLPHAGADLVEELLTDAWMRKAPQKLVNELSHR
ncbi:MAG TPA: MmcQ/YjbR family DNA-binding protein [Acidimicrobiales bacterium]|nr:MmcQ/YjbR family DNA-binding protein [Acidimicrobiales bacterium]